MLEIRGKDFYLDHEKFHIYSGAIHYFRMLPEYWEDRLLKLKAMGCNTVETYVCWNLHEPQKGTYDFEGMLDLAGFLQLAQRLGLYAIVRPAPYICAEWDFGGLPAWLLAQDLHVRCSDPLFLGHVKDFYEVILPMLAPLQISRGGNIIAMQIENEYGSYGDDKEYLTFIEQTMRACGIEVLLFTSDNPNDSMLTGGSLPHIFKTLNFGSRAEEAFRFLQSRQPDMPLMCMEFWVGWFDHFGEAHHTRDARSVAEEVKAMLNLGASFNFYMFYGGTNFGFTAGANCDALYEPTISSYDDDALLNEWGGYTPKYHAVREALCAHQGITPPPLPPEPRCQAIGRVPLTQSASLLQQVKRLSKGHYRSVAPKSMEYYGQSFGLILYRKKLDGPYDSNTLYLQEVHDRAYLFLNQEFQGVIYRNDSQQSIKLPAIPAEGAVLEILVEAMGRSNYGPHLQDRKGITQAIRLENQNLFHWEVYSLPLDDLSPLEYSDNEASCPIFLKGQFAAPSKAECFINLNGFTKGYVFINGFNLGRYWKIGPQQTLYLPGALLKDQNEIVVLELESYGQKEITITDQPVLDKNL